MRIFAWSITSLSVAMSLILSLTIASALGTLLGNMGLLWVVGTLVKRQEKKQIKELQKLQQGYLDMVEREKKRMENYAKMEG
jgi:uncharacterized protein YhhL (DUF1145 family)